MRIQINDHEQKYLFLLVQSSLVHVVTKGAEPVFGKGEWKLEGQTADALEGRPEKFAAEEVPAAPQYPKELYFYQGQRLFSEPFPLPPAGILSQKMGAFVTYEENGRLRGCIGMMATFQPLYKTVARMACDAAVEDRRFSPISVRDLPAITFEISVLGPISPCPDLSSVQIGKHGLILEVLGRSAVFLPQVAKEQGWTVPQTLDNLCLKAGVPVGAWKEKSAQIFWYEALVLHP